MDKYKLATIVLAVGWAGYIVMDYRSVKKAMRLFELKDDRLKKVIDINNYLIELLDRNDVRLSEFDRIALTEYRDALNSSLSHDISCL